MSPNVPSNWRYESLGKCCAIISGATPRRNVPEYWNNDIPWVTPKDISSLDGSVLEDAPEYISKAGYKSCSASILPKGSVLFSSRAPIGLVALAGREMCTNQGFKSLIPGKRVHSEYLYHCMKWMAPKIAELGNGATFKEVSKEVVSRVEIPLPPLLEQKRIAAILDKADVICRKRQTAIILADDFLRATFLDMFGDPITNPKGWDKAPIGNFCRIKRGASPRPIAKFLGGEVPWIKIGDGTKNDDIYISDTKDKIIQEGANKSVYLEPGSLIFANCGVSLGFARIIKMAGCIHDGWLSFDNFDHKINKIYLLNALNSITNHFRKIAPDGTQPNLNTSIMKNFQLPIPPRKSQDKYSNIVIKYQENKKGLMNILQESIALFNSISQRAFRGEL